MLGNSTNFYGFKDFYFWIFFEFSAWFAPGYSISHYLGSMHSTFFPFSSVLNSKWPVTSGTGQWVTKFLPILLKYFCLAMWIHWIKSFFKFLNVERLSILLEGETFYENPLCPQWGFYIAINPRILLIDIKIIKRRSPID